MNINPQQVTRPAGKERKFYYVSGQPVELWENADKPFGWSEEELAEYADSEEWENLFNALVFSATLENNEND